MTHPPSWRGDTAVGRGPDRGATPPERRRDARPGERQWTIKKKDHTIFRCDLRRDGAEVEVQVFLDGLFLVGRRFAQADDALKHVERLKHKYLERGDTLV
jgi:hypothetical protein